jgi:hypothetical protein
LVVEQVVDIQMAVHRQVVQAAAVPDLLTVEILVRLVQAVREMPVVMVLIHQAILVTVAAVVELVESDKLQTFAHRFQAVTVVQD